MRLGALALRLDVRRSSSASASSSGELHLLARGQLRHIAATPTSALDSASGGRWRSPARPVHHRLVAGLIVGNFFPRRPRRLAGGDAAGVVREDGDRHPGASLGVQAAGARGLATAVLFRGLAAIVGPTSSTGRSCTSWRRRFFGLPRVAAPLASGVSICGVSAAMATAAAIRARRRADHDLVDCRSVRRRRCFDPALRRAGRSWRTSRWSRARGWGSPSRTDGAAVASGAITDALIRAKAAARASCTRRGGSIPHDDDRPRCSSTCSSAFWGVGPAVVWNVGRSTAPGAPPRIRYLASLPEVRARLLP